MVDYDEVLALAKEHRPKLIVCGGSAYPRTVETDKLPRDRRRGRRAAPLRHGALRGARRGRAAPEPGRALRLRHLDDAQDARRPARRVHPLPRGARAGRRPRRLPRDAGRAAEHTIAAKATCFKIAGTEPFREYQSQVRRERRRARGVAAGGRARVLTGGTDTHLLQIDLRNSEWTGKDAEERLHEVKITVNRNTVPFDERPPTVASGVRIGTPAMTMRGFDEDDFREVGARSSSRRSATPPTSPGCAAASTRSARTGRSTRASAATRRTSHERPERRLTVVDHPLVQHKLSYLRDKETPTVHFRKLVNELTLLLTYEATKDMPTEAHRDRDAARDDDRPADQGQEGRRLPGAARRHGHARRRPLARLERARRLHRAVPRRGDARARSSTS